MNRKAIWILALLAALPQAATAGPPGCGNTIPCDTQADCPTYGTRVDLKCVDDPRDDCDPETGGIDCEGICVLPLPDFCGGFALFPCPPGTMCIETATQGVDGGGCAFDCGGRDCGGECVLFDDRPKNCHGRDRTKCSRGQTCIDVMMDDCHAACDGFRCPSSCGWAAPDECVLGDPRSCPGPMLCVAFDDFSPYPQPPGEQVIQCALLPDLSCEGNRDCPIGMRCGDDPDDNCDPAAGRKNCRTCCVPL